MTVDLMIRPSARPHRKRRKGAVLVLMAFFMIVVVAMAAFALDCGMITLVRTQLQCAADAAALAGAGALPNGTSAAQTAAQTVAAANTAAGSSVSISPTQDIQFGTWDSTALTFTVLSGSAAASANAVRVTCVMSSARGNPMNLFFSRIFGRSTNNIQAQATAMASNIRCGAFVGLNYVNISGSSYTDSYDSSVAPYAKASAGSQGNVCSNESITLSGGSTIHGDAHSGPGYTVNGASYVTGSTAPLTQPLSEPAVNFGDSATVNNNANIPLSKDGKHPLVNGTFSLSGGDSVTLPAGTYYFDSFSLSGSSTMTVNGATVIYCTGSFNASGGTVLNTTALPANCQIYCTGSTLTLSGGTQFYGVVYAPTSNITRSGGSSDCFGMIVGASLTLSGGGGCHYDQALGSIFSSGSQYPQLVQ